MIHKIWHVSKHLSLWLLVASAIALSVIRLLLMGVDGYKNDLERQLFELTQIPIEIGQLRASMRGINPEIVLKDIQVMANDGQISPAIKLAEFRLGIDLAELLLTQQLLPSSWLTLVGVELSIVRKMDGSISISGLNASDSEQPLWLLEGGHYEVLKSKITWIDQQRKTSAVTFDQVDLLIKNKFEQKRHEIHLLSKLPEQYGESLRVSMSIHGNVFESDDIDGMVYVEGKNIHLAELITGELPSEIKLMTGKGDFKQWGVFKRSALVATAGEIDAEGIRLHKHDEVFEINALNTLFNAHNSNESGWQVGVKEFALKSNQKQWPVAAFNLYANKALTQVSASVARLDLEVLAEITRFFVSRSDEQTETLKKLQLKGELNNLRAYIDIENEKYAINGFFKEITATIPDAKIQLENLTGSIKGTLQEGVINLDTQEGMLFFSGLFREAFTLNQLKGKIAWLQTEKNWQIESQQLVLDTNHVETQSQLTVIIPKNDDAVFMDLQSTFANLNDVSNAKKYYPVSIMETGVVDWLDNAFVAGKVNKGGLLVYGELNKFPFLDNQGVFEVAFDLVNGNLNYAPGWPHLQQMAADIVFFQNGVSIDITHAESNGLTVKQALIDIPSFATDGDVLVEGLIEGQIADSLTFLQKSPLHKPIDKVLQAITPVGLTNIDLGLKIPFADPGLTQVDVVAHLNNAQLNINAIELKVKEVTGELKVTEKGVFAKNITANAMSYPLSVNVDSDVNKTQININGKTDIKQLQKHFSFVDNELVRQGRIKGKTDYQVELDLPVTDNKAAELKIKTDLRGVTVKLPEGLSKSAEQVKALNISMQLSEQALLPLRLNYSEQIKAALNIDKQHSKVHSAHIVYGEGTARFSAKAGTNIQIEQDVFDAAAWSELVSASVAKAVDPTNGLASISLTTKQLYWKDKNYGGLEIALKQLQQKWQGSLSCSIAKGAFVIPINKSEEKIKLQMAYLNLTELLQFNKQIEGIESDDVPLVQVFSDVLLWNSVDLGRLEIETDKLLDGVRFKHINVISDKHTLALKADWIKTDKGSITELYGDFTEQEAGAFLSEMKFTDDIKETQANIGFFGTWSGTPYQFSLQTIDAEIDLELKEGRIASIEPGFGRLLGLIAVEQWLKRVMLDFGDIYKQGLSFNTVAGHFNLSNGLLTTKNLMVDAIPARISLVGEADLVAETLDYQVTVVPKSSAALPIAGTIVGGIAGAITQVFDDNYKEGYFFGSKYKITGPWKNVTVTPLLNQGGILKKTWTGLTDFSWMQSGQVLDK